MSATPSPGARRRRDIASLLIRVWGIAVYAFLLLPIQVQFLHVPSPSVSPTNLLFNVISAPAGAWAYYRARRLDVRLSLALCAGTAPGVIVGALLRSTWLADANRFGIIAAAVLVLLGLRILIEAVRPARLGRTPSP